MKLRPRNVGAVETFQRLLLVLSFLNLVLCQQRTFLLATDFLAAACTGEVNDDILNCWLGPGNWAIHAPSLGVALAARETIIAGQDPGCTELGSTPTFSSELSLPTNGSSPLLRVPDSSSLTLSNLSISGPLLREPQQVEPPAPLAIDLGFGAQLRLVNVALTVSCRSLSLFQAFACGQQRPSPYFSVDYGTLTFVSYSTSVLEMVNTTLTCTPAPSPLAASSAALPPPPCVAVVASSGPDVLAALEGRGRPLLPSAVPFYIYIARDFALLDTRTPSCAAADLGSDPSSDVNKSTALTGPVAGAAAAQPQPAPQPSSFSPATPLQMNQDRLYISGATGGATRLDLTGTTSLIILGAKSRVTLSNLTLAGLPLGPPGPSFFLAMAMLRVFMWTFSFPRSNLASLRARLSLVGVTMELSPVEVVALSVDIAAPTAPTPTPPVPPPWAAPPADMPSRPGSSSSAAVAAWVPVCVGDLVFFGDAPREAELLQPASENSTAAAGSTGSATAGLVATPVVPATSSSRALYGPPPGLRIRRAISSYSLTMYFEDVVLEPTAAASAADVGPAATADWRLEPLCQLLPLQPSDEPPRVQADMSADYINLEPPLWPGMLTTPVADGRLLFVSQQDSWLSTGPPFDGTPTFSQLQSYIEGPAVLLGGPIRPRLLNTLFVAGGINLRGPGASLTLRRLTMLNLAAAGLHPMAKAQMAEAAGNTGGAPAQRRRRARRELAVEGAGAGDGEGRGRWMQRRSIPEQPPQMLQSGPKDARMLVEARQATPPPLMPSPPRKPPGWFPAGTDPTGGLPAGMANFTSCLWILDFDRTGGSSGSSSGSSSSGSSSAGLLDSVVLVLPPSEVALFAWVWSRNDTAGVTDPAVAAQLRDMLDRSELAAGGVAADGWGPSLRFSRLTWCGLQGENVTMAPATAKALLDLVAGFEQGHDYWGHGGTGSAIELALPIVYGNSGDGGRGGGGSSSASSPSPPPLPMVRATPPRSPAPTDCIAALGDASDTSGNGCVEHTHTLNDTAPNPSSPSGRDASDTSGAVQAGSGTDTRMLIVAIVCGVTAGLLAALLVCIGAVLCIRWRRRRRRSGQSSKPAAPATAAAATDADAEPTPMLLDAPSSQLGVSSAAAGCGPAAAPPLKSGSVPVTSEFTQSSGSVSLAPVPAPGPGAVGDPVAALEMEQRPSGMPPLPPRMWTGAALKSAAPVAVADDFGGADPLGCSGSAVGGGGGGGTAVAAVSPVSSAWHDGVTHGSERVMRGAEPSSSSRKRMASVEVATDLAAAGREVKKCGSDDVTSANDMVSAGGTTTVAATAAVMSAVSDMEKQQMLRDIALSLHTRMLRMREAVAHGGDGGGSSDGAVASAAAELASQDQDSHRPMGHHARTSEPDAAAVLVGGPSAAPQAPTTGPAAAAALRGAAAVDGGIGDCVAVSGGGSGGGGGSGSGGSNSCALTVTGELGRGAQGVVYRGRWRGIDVAIKNLLLHGPLHGQDLSETAAAGASPTPPSMSARHRALREAALSVAVSAHPNVVATYHVDACALGPPLPGPGPGLEGGAGTEAGGASSAAAPGVMAAPCWKITLISQLCDGGSLRSALASGLLARCVVSSSQPQSGSGSGMAASTSATSAAGAAVPRSAADAGGGDGGGAIQARPAAYGGTDSAVLLRQQQQPQELQPRVLLLVALDIASGVAQLHSTNVVHGDVSSDNVLLASLTAAAPSASDYGRGRGVTFSCTTFSGSVSDPRSRGDEFGPVGGAGTGTTGGGAESSDRTQTHGSWFSNSSDALALLVDLPYEQPPRRPIWGASSDGSAAADSDRAAAAAAGGAAAAAAAAAAALGRYGYVAKLCDLGLAEVMPQGQQYLATPCRRSSVYSAPELVIAGRISPASDVYSWAVLCWELAAGMPLPALLGSPAGAAVRAWLAATDVVGPMPGQEPEPEVLEAATLPPSLLTWPPYVPHALVVLVSECLRADPAGRPTAKDVVQRLEHIIISL